MAHLREEGALGTVGLQGLVAGHFEMGVGLLQRGGALLDAPLQMLVEGADAGLPIEQVLLATAHFPDHVAKGAGQHADLALGVGRQRHGLVAAGQSLGGAGDLSQRPNQQLREQQGQQEAGADE